MNKYSSIFIKMYEYKDTVNLLMSSTYAPISNVYSSVGICTFSKRGDDQEMNVFLSSCPDIAPLPAYDLGYIRIKNPLIKRFENIPKS